jgi:hypothetical protein
VNFCGLRQEYVTNKTKKTEELRKTVEDLDGLIQQIYRDQDLTQGEEVPSSHQAGLSPLSSFFSARDMIALFP